MAHALKVKTFLSLRIITDIAPNDQHFIVLPQRLNCVMICVVGPTVHLEGRCGGRLFDCRDVSFIVGEAEDKGVPLGVDRAMDKMQKGECCSLYLKPK